MADNENNPSAPNPEQPQASAQPQAPAQPQVAPQVAPQAGQQVPPPPPVGEPVQAPAPASAPQPEQAPANQAQAGQQSQAPAQQPQAQQPQAQQPQNQQPQNQQPKPTYRENGAFSFFATPSDPDDDPAPMGIGFKIGWFVLGLIGGMLGLVMTFISTTTLSQKRRKQALFWCWIGFAVQAVIFLVAVWTGASIPLPTGASSATQSATTGSSSAFG